MTKQLAVLLLFGVSFAHAKKFEAVPGEYIAKLKPGVKAESVQRLGISSNFVFQKALSKTSNLVKIKTTSLKGIHNLENSSLFEYVEPNYIYRAWKSPNDSAYQQLWGMKNVGQQDSNNQVGVAGIDIKAEEAWELSRGSKEVVVAVIDTGLDYTIEDLKDNAWVNEKELNGKPDVDDDGNGFIDDIHGYDFVNKDGDPMDDHGHGSHVSGTIGAQGDNGKDVAGVNWNVRIMGVKFLSAEGSGTLEDAVLSIDYATQMGAMMSNNSWGGGGYSKALEEAIERANAANSLFVAAAGNHNANNDEEPSYPASYPVANVMSVAAIDNRGQLASFSCYGRKSVHIGAPGVKVLSTTPQGLQSWSGTSMATPHVTGVAALLKAYQPTLSAVEIKQRLLATASPLTALKSRTSSGGLVNAYAALTNTVPPPNPNDPENWAKMEYALSSAHPLANNLKQEFKIKVPGVKRFSIYFSKFEMETGYDTATIIDGAGSAIGTMSGNQSDSFSVTIDGEEATILLATDVSQESYGFDISHIAYEK